MTKELSIKYITDLAKQKIVPVSMLVEVCHTCNEKCIHCCLPEHDSKGLTLLQYEKLFDQMVETGTLFVILTGGEPFTRNDFLDIIRSARAHHFRYCARCPGLALFEDGNLFGCSTVAKNNAILRKEIGVYPNQTHIFAERCK